MGYYVRGESKNFTLKKQYDAQVRDAVRELNTKDDLKIGGSSSGEKWFSWMNNFDFTKDFTSADILEGLGFEVKQDDEGNIVWLYYDSKIGQEELFLSVMAPFIESGSVIEWTGEDGDHWMHQVIDGVLYYHYLWWSHRVTMKSPTAHQTRDNQITTRLN